jgi:HAD superfamily hydrolase (TIGR01490 family)
MSDPSTTAAPPPRDLCLFDLDHTLLPLDSDHAWNEFMIRLGWVDGRAHRAANDRFYEDYQAGTLNIAAYVEFTTRALRERPATQAHEAQQRFMDEVIRPALLPQALELVRQHQARGDLVAIITATNEFITRPIARAFGVEHLLAVALERDARGTITGRIQGVPTFREGKVIRTEQWLAGQGASFASFRRVSVYSDSLNDLPLLERATQPVATNPSPALETLARERGWRVLRLFHDQEIH